MPESIIYNNAYFDNDPANELLARIGLEQEEAEKMLIGALFSLDDYADKTRQVIREKGLTPDKLRHPAHAETIRRYLEGEAITDILLSVKGYKHTSYISDVVKPEDYTKFIDKILEGYARRVAFSRGQNLMQAIANGSSLADLQQHSEGITEVVIAGKPKPKPGTGKVSTFADMAEAIGPIEWEWPGWLPRNMLSMLAAATGEGKSMLLMRLAGTFICGWPWPDGTPFTGKTGSVVWAEAEGAQALNLQRAREYGIPLDKIITPLDDPTRDFEIRRDDHMAAFADKTYRPDTVWSLVDSLSGATGGAREKDSEHGQYTKMLAQLCRDTGKPISISHHLRKKNQFDSDVVTLDRVRGSTTIVQYARVIWALDVPDPQNKEAKRLSVIKSNLDKFPKPIGVRIGNGVQFGEAPQEPRPETVADKAIELLHSLLEREPQPHTEIERAYKALGLSEPTVNRAKKALNIVSVKKGDSWYWSLPAREDEEYNN